MDLLSSDDFFVLFGQLLSTGEKFKSSCQSVTLFLEPVTATGDTNGLEVPSPGRNNLLHVNKNDLIKDTTDKQYYFSNYY